MCGIIGYIGDADTKDLIINGLKKLEYRGYDSSGVSYIRDGKIITHKELGNVKNLEKSIKNIDFSHIAIAHTRWATHGKPNKKNAHPHNSGDWSLVHNGIIDNADMLKSTLHEHIFRSDTDTEVIVALLDYISSIEKDHMRALIKACDMLRGSFALAVLNATRPDELYVARNKSPIYVALTHDGAIVTSDLSVLENKATHYYTLGNYEFARLTADNITFYDKHAKIIKKHAKKLILRDISSDLNGFDHFMLKEIHDIPTSLTSTFDAIKRADTLKDIDYSHIREVHLFGCGTAYHTAKMGALFIEQLAHIPAYAHIASDYNDRDHTITTDALYVFISQSGETIDTINAMHIVQTHAKAVVITNVHHSTLALESDYLTPIEAGKEVSVASTKAYNTLNLATLLLASDIAHAKGHTSDDLDITTITDACKDCLQDIDAVRDIADIVAEYSKVFFIGRKFDYITALEGSLKLKEISYINSSAFPAGELKHGTLALVDKKTLVVVVATDATLQQKIDSALSEVKARNAKVLLVTSLDAKPESYDYLIRVPSLDILSTQLVSIIPLQLLAYFVSTKKGINPDQPKNLAKSVTVE